MLKTASTLFLIQFMFLISLVNAQPRKNTKSVDICIYGGTSAGIIAAYTAKKMNKTVLLIEPGTRLGGLSSGGLGFTDIGNKYVVTGLALDFYRRIGRHYGKFEQWIFEPKVAEEIFKEYVREANINVVYSQRLSKVNKTGAEITGIELESSTGKSGIMRVKAKQFIDCSYEGDLMAAAGVSYAIGRESNSLYNETVSGVQLKHEHQFPDGIDPYQIPGEPASGLLWGISDCTLQPNGTGDKKIQAYNFRICLTNNPANRIAITRPANYDSTRYTLLLRYLAARPAKDLGSFLKMSPMPNHKTDINNNGPFSTDMIGMNYDYPDGNYKTRNAIFKQHEEYTKGLLYFAGHDLRVSLHIRKQMQEWGYPVDEYPETNHWTPQLYVREARRMLGAYVMTQANCERKNIADDGIGMAAYTMDSHNAQRIVVNGMVKNEGDVQLRGIRPYPISYRSITPKAQECSNLLVPVCLSASHMAYGSIRMEPVFMVLGQSAAVAACLALDKHATVQKVDIKALQNELKNNPLADHRVKEILVDNDDITGVSVTGTWRTEIMGGYGPSFLKDSLTIAKSAVRFSPVITNAGNYQIYVYVPKIPRTTDITTVHIFDGENEITKTFSKKDIQVIGQASGEWVSLGSSYLPEKKHCYVEITNEGANGTVVADAVLFVPGIEPHKL